MGGGLERWEGEGRRNQFRASGREEHRRVNLQFTVLCVADFILVSIGSIRMHSSCGAENEMYNFKKYYTRYKYAA